MFSNHLAEVIYTNLRLKQTENKKKTLFECRK